MFVEVAFPLPLNRTFHYRLSNGSHPASAYIGRRVLAPFGKKALVGYAVATQEEAPNFPTKPIQTWIDEQPLIDSTLIELAQWLSKTYLCSFGEALATILPTQLRPPKRPKAETIPIPPISPGDMHQLSDEQGLALKQFIAAVDAQTFHPFLLRGITDSGKTELYLQTIDHAIKQNRQAIFLLPEIALTPPFIDRLKARYASDKVGIWHSGVSAGERFRTWERARRGELHIMLGARSAVFAPFPKLGVIIMDEEHEPTYKQEDRPRYHAREVALWRAERVGATLIMGSATPSIESYYNAKKGTYALTELTSRVEMRQLPPVTIINRGRASPPTPLPAGEGGPSKTVGEAKRKRRGSSFEVFSEPLKLALEQRLARREQVILFVNRRGFTPFLRCSKCGWVARCERCVLALALHVKGGETVARFQGKDKQLPVPADSVLQCHTCLRTYAVPIDCPSCHSIRLGHFGIGTQRVEEEVKHLFPFVKIARLDRDVEQFKKTYEKVYRSFVAKELDVLVGTQMIAKGFDYPGVTLVGVVDADVTLHLPDFRSAERTFQLLTQVSGRTGRGDQGGKVLIQTHYPEHYAIQAAQEHDYVRFYTEEMTHREALNYPPYCRLINIVIRARKEELAQTAADELAEQLGQLNSGADVLGPAPASYSRVRGNFRYQIVLKGTDQTLAPCAEFLHGKRLSKAFMVVDIDPVNLI